MEQDIVNHSAYKEELKRWLKISVLLFLAVLFVLVILQVRQMTRLENVRERLNSMQKKAQPLNALLDQKGSLKKEVEQLQTKLNKIDKHKNNPKNPVAALTHLSTLISDDLNVQSIDIQKNTFSLQGTCKNTQQALVFAQKMSQFPEFTKVSLTNLSPESGAFVFNINGTLTLVS